MPRCSAGKCGSKIGTIILLSPTSADEKHVDGKIASLNLAGNVTLLDGASMLLAMAQISDVNDCAPYAAGRCIDLDSGGIKRPTVSLSMLATSI